MSKFLAISSDGFNTQPPEGGCAYQKGSIPDYMQVSTHNRPKAAAHRYHHLHHSI